MEAAAEGPPKRGPPGSPEESERKLARTLVDFRNEDEVVTLSEPDDFQYETYIANNFPVDYKLKVYGISKKAIDRIGNKNFEIVIPDTWALNDSCFKNLKKLVSVTFNTTAEDYTIPSRSFEKCFNLKTVKFINPTDLTIEGKAFKDCISLKTFPFNLITSMTDNENYFNCGFEVIDLTEIKFLGPLPTNCFAFDLNEIQELRRKIFFPNNYYFNTTYSEFKSFVECEQQSEQDMKYELWKPIRSKCKAKIETLSSPQMIYTGRYYQLNDFDIHNLHLGDDWNNIFDYEFEQTMDILFRIINYGWDHLTRPKYICVPPIIRNYIVDNYDFDEDIYKFVEYRPDINFWYTCRLEDGTTIRNPFCLPRVQEKVSGVMAIKRFADGMNVDFPNEMIEYIFNARRI